jgi:hypothetical protein
MGIGTCKFKGPTYISQNPGSLETFQRDYRLDSHGQFLKNTNQIWRGILNLQSGPRIHELDMETLAISRADMLKKRI